MPWRETTPMDERARFIRDFDSELFNFTELCRHYRISRKTGYECLERYRALGDEGLADRSHAPRSCPHRTNPAIVEHLIAFKKKHRSWGPRKLIRELRKRQPHVPWPAPSTAGSILKQHGLVKSRRNRPHPGHPGQGDTPMDHPNAVWTADFKGQFKTRDGVYCYPLTIIDGFSRFLLACQALPSTHHELVLPVFQRLFREFGLPDVIRTDNGSPFASQAIQRLSRLHVWWIKLGISPELILPAHPEQNGRHERFHRTLKDATVRPPSANLRAQQRAFDRFRSEFNLERPHEALGQNPPGDFYLPSLRPFPRRIPEIVYPPHFEVRRVSRNGGVRWSSGWVNISHVLSEEYIGFEEITCGVWSVYFGPMFLGRFDECNLKLFGSYPYNMPL